MINIYSDYKGDLRIGNIEMFLEIVLDNYLKIKKIESKIEKLKLCRTKEDIFSKKYKEYSKEILELHYKNHKFTVQSIILLTTFYEALINEIGSTEFGQSYFKKNLDRLSILAKWEIVLKLIYDKGLDKNAHYFENLTRLIKSRNELIHYRTLKVQGDQNNEVTIDDLSKEVEKQPDYTKILKDNISTLKLFYKDLKLIDNEKGILKYVEIAKQINRI